MTAPPARQTCSVALCTYNGRDYLPAQWQSLLDQQQRPDEVIVCDDGSTDGTVALLRRLAADAPFRVTIRENPVRLGYNKNFEQALRHCTGELIFLCDQDDYWLPRKISVLTDYLLQHPEQQLVFCDAWVADERLQNQQYRFWPVVRFDEGQRTRWRAGNVMDVLLDGNRVMGCATALRHSLLSTALPIPTDLPGHIYDDWLAMVAAAIGAIGFVDEPLQLYRTHEQQQVGIRPSVVGERVRLRDRFSRPRADKLAPLQSQQAQLRAVAQRLAERLPDDAPGWPPLRQRIAHFDMRAQLSDNRLRRVLPVLSDLGRGNYHRYADPWANWYAPYLAALGDLLE